NSVAMMPYNLLCATGRANLIARYTVVEIGPYLGLIVVGAYWLGAVGAALAWSTRVAASTVYLFLMAHWSLDVPLALEPGEGRRLAVAAASVLPVAALAAAGPALGVLAAALAVWLAG